MQIMKTLSVYLRMLSQCYKGPEPGATGTSFGSSTVRTHGAVRCSDTVPKTVSVLCAAPCLETWLLGANMVWLITIETREHSGLIYRLRFRREFDS